MTAGAFDRALAQLDAAVDSLLCADVSDLEQAALVRTLESFEAKRRRLEAVEHRLLMQANDTSLPAACGQHGLGALLSTVLRIDPGEGRRRATRAVDLGPRRTLTGEPLEPSLPLLASAVADGGVSAEQADVIIDAVERIPPAAPAAAWPVVEKMLVEAAQLEAPRQLRRTAIELLARLDPDGLEPVEDRQHRQRGFTLIKNPDGSYSPRGRWTAELTAHWQAILDSLAAPQPVDDHPDPRSAAQRRHDAMLEAARRLLRSATLPDCGGIPVTVLATTTIGELTAAADLGLSGLAAEHGHDLGSLLASDSAGLATLAHGQTVSVKTLLAMACEAVVVPVVFNDAGGVLAYGRTRRLASPGQRLALLARDGGCCFPGCDRPGAWSEVHHVVEWINGGATDLDNLCLLCAYHHRSFATNGWQVIMTDGRPEWLPPRWLDPAQRPRRNTVHHRPEIVFREPTAA